MFSLRLDQWWTFLFRQKKNKAGQRFGFVRFPAGSDVCVLEERLNTIWIGSFKLRANVCKFSRPSPPFFSTPVPSSPEALDTQLPRASTVVSLENKGCLVLHPDSVEEDWLKLCLVGEVQDLNYRSKLQDLVDRGGVGRCKVKTFGESSVLLECKCIEELVDIQSESKAWSAGWLSNLSPWSEELKGTSRLVWVRCFGVPLQLWSRSSFSQIAGQVGRVVMVDSNTVEKNVLDYGRVLIYCLSSEKICSQVKVSFLGDFLDIKVVEEGDGTRFESSSFSETSKFGVENGVDKGNCTSSLSQRGSGSGGWSEQPSTSASKFDLPDSFENPFSSQLHSYVPNMILGKMGGDHGEGYAGGLGVTSGEPEDDKFVCTGWKENDRSVDGSWSERLPVSSSSEVVSLSRVIDSIFSLAQDDFNIDTPLDFVTSSMSDSVGSSTTFCKHQEALDDRIDPKKSVVFGNVVENGNLRKSVCHTKFDSDKKFWDDVKFSNESGCTFDRPDLSFSDVMEIASQDGSKNEDLVVESEVETGSGLPKMNKCKGKKFSVVRALQLCRAKEGSFFDARYRSLLRKKLWNDLNNMEYDFSVDKSLILPIRQPRRFAVIGDTDYKITVHTLPVNQIGVLSDYGIWKFGD